MYNNKIDKLDALILLAGDVLIEKNLNSDLLQCDRRRSDGQGQGIPS